MTGRIDQLQNYLGYPLFLWEGLLTLLSMLTVGLIIAFTTTFYLKKKDESTRVAGVILEKRIEAQHEILGFLEGHSQKYEMPQKEAVPMRELLSDYDFALPHHPHIQYADVFASLDSYREFFNTFESLFSRYKLWLDKKVRHQMLLLQSYFTAINASLIVFNRIPLPAGVVLERQEMDDLGDRLLLILGIALDEEFNTLLMDLEVLLVRSIYKLDLTRPKRSVFEQRSKNKEARKIEHFLINKSLMGKSLPKIVILAMDIAAASKNVELAEEDVEQYLSRFPNIDNQAAVS